MDRLTKIAIRNNLPESEKVFAGGGGYPLKNDPCEHWAWRNNAFNEDELDAIIRLGEGHELHNGAIGGGALVPKIRDSFVSFIHPKQTTNWLFERIAVIVNESNSQYFGFDLFGFVEGLQFTKYTAPHQHYEWHIDKGFGNTVRKLSLSIQLSSPSDYEGGDLQLMFGKKPTTLPKERGFITIFPSYAVHRVTPVKKGTRYSLVAWVSGPPFK